MKRTYNINLVEGHLLISDNGNTILVDTGSPITVHSKTNLSFMDRDFKVHTSIMGNRISDLSSLVGISFTTLLGMDILSQYRVVFDYKNQQITFQTEEEPGLEGTSYPLIDVMGSKAIRMNMKGQPLTMVLDTGAPLSYVDAAVTENLEPVGEKEDFHPIAGRYTTRIYELEAEIDDKKFTGTYGNLPAMMRMSLKLGGLDGIIGYDFFQSFRVMLDFKKDSVAITC